MQPHVGAALARAREQNTRVLNAMREDITDLRTHVDNGFARVDTAFTEMRGKFDATAAGQQQLADLIQTLIDRPDENTGA